MRKEKLDEIEKLMKQYKTIEKSEECQVSEGFIKIHEAKYKLNNGETITRDTIRKGKINGNSAIILPILENKEILFVVQPRVFTKNTVTVEIPAGLVEIDEEPIIAAKRELEEETGCIAEEFITGIRGYGDTSLSSAITNFFIAKNVKKVKEQHLDKDEYISIFTCTYAEALELIDLGYICDLNTIFMLKLAKDLF